MGHCCKQKLAKELDLYGSPPVPNTGDSVRKSPCPAIESMIHDARTTITPYTIDLFYSGVSHADFLIDSMKELPKPLGLVAAGMVGLLARTRTKRLFACVASMGAMSALLYPEEFREAIDLGSYLSKKTLKDLGILDK